MSCINTVRCYFNIGLQRVKMRRCNARNMYSYLRYSTEKEIVNNFSLFYKNNWILFIYLYAERDYYSLLLFICWLWATELIWKCLCQPGLNLMKPKKLQKPRLDFSLSKPPPPPFPLPQPAYLFPTSQLFCKPTNGEPPQWVKTQYSQRSKYSPSPSRKGYFSYSQNLIVDS